MREKIVEVCNRAGIHARPSSVIVKKTKEFTSSVLLEYGSNTINAKSILGIITLGAPFGSKIKIIADGPDENEAVEALSALFESKFEEE